VKIIVTGALGHIGSALIRSLPLQFPKAEIMMIDDLSTQRYTSLFNLPSGMKYRFIEKNVKAVAWEAVLEHADVVIHLAALTDAAGTADKPDLVHQNNFESTKILAEACLKAGVPFLFPSSTSVYGSQEEQVDEECQELAPQSPYAACKIKEEALVRDLCAKGLQGVICRFGTIYGVSPGMRFHTAVNKFCWQAVMRQPITVWETALHQKRPYLALDDCCRAISWILENKLYNGQLYNVVSNNFTVQTVIDEIQKNISDLHVELVQHKIMNQLSYEVMSDKFRATGFSFEGQLASGIGETINLLKNANG